MGFDIINVIKKSHEALLSAEFNFKNGYCETCVNRLYYAIFYIVSALAYKENFITSKHSQLMGWFNKNFVYEKRIFSEKVFAIYKEAFSNRQKSDYDFSYIPDKEEILMMINDTKYFIEEVERYIKIS